MRILVFGFFLGVLLVNSAQAGDKTWAAKRGEWISVVSLMPACDRRVALMMTADKVQKNSDNLEMDTPDNVLWSLKVTAIESSELANIGREAGYEEWADLMAVKRDIFLDVIRGEASSGSADKRIRKWAGEYQALASELRGECSRSLRVVPEDVIQVRDGLMTWVSATARTSAQ